ncbi:hypothetical protein FGSG_02644 [Fusarium graminearum PH-1]|uniref:hypothetical protein n=1 Tax=Gibberella zeae (strain ATCC MYA-4620 / CBS 123657 / FGSC 9075 / NRRL 31084 / PH-1) TaxID=229533 RepID=UPI00021F1C96|nr:hypothetical protein FGSG_02644 [Fusarium graminearum PH-1]ESU08109.1 hypothetical protein FGSG_02644 [Fusarium graminearum PH-1]|eukprot:XP_011318594.1 hypothetical protein FGSG_02644 [Fusarium graminearum PH-1]
MDDCPRTVEWAQAETSELHWAIKRLKGIIDDPNSVAKTSGTSLGLHDATVTISELITTCDGLIEVLKPFDDNRALAHTKLGKVKWLRVQDDVVKYIREMQAHKGSVTLILNILQWSSVGTTLANWKEEDDDTDNSSVVTSHKDHEDWATFRSSNERSLSFPSQGNIVPQIARPVPKRTSSAETSAKIGSNGISSPPRREFEETLEKSDVYQRVYNSTDAFSVYSTRNRSVVGSVMTSFSLADNSSILSAFPIMSRTELKHPEYYAHMNGNQRISKDLMRAITMRSVVKSPIEPSPEAPFSLKQFRSPPNCGENVIGRWSNSRTKTWKSKEFRTEIQYEVPFIFVSTPGSTEGYIDGAQIHFIDGTRKSLDATRTDLEPPPTSTKTKTGRIVKNERATWLTLLSGLQKMENQSQNWTRQQIMSLRPRPASAQAILSSVAGKHSLRTALQCERKSWDDMPPSVNRPYATTTMSQLIEMIAMLGIYWRDFNPTYNIYQAEGNGFLVKGHKISGLGIMFYVQALDKAIFEENRPVPNREVTRLAFGQLPNILSQVVRLGSRKDMADTLATLGCDRTSSNYFLRDGTMTSHIFPRMMGQVFHIKDLCFRYIPNPCYNIWSTKGFSLPRLLIAYRKHLQEDKDTAHGQLFIHLNTLLSPKTEIQLHRDVPTSYNWQAQDALHSDVIGSHFQEVLSQMNGQTFPRFNGSDKEDVLMRTYFQQILPAVQISCSARFFNLKTADSEFNVVKGGYAQTAEKDTSSEYTDGYTSK